MKQFLLHPRWNFFRRLTWKLTVRYALITLLALIAVEVLALAAANHLLFRTTFLPRLATDALLLTAPELCPYLEADPPDAAGLEDWFREHHSDGFTGSGADDRFFVLDPHGRLIIGYPGSETDPAGNPFDSLSVAGSGPPLVAALSGETNPERLFSYDPDTTHFVAAVPVFNQAGTLAGVLVFESRLSQIQNEPQQYIVMIGLSILCFGSLALAIGTVFGYLTARGLTRRLRTMADTAGAWGAGDFSSKIEDNSADEIGELAAELNRMSTQLQDVMRTRQQLAGMEERNRLARDLHDSVKQQVFAVSMTLGAAQSLWQRDPPAAQERVEAAMQLARRAQQELTALIHMLRPAELVGRNLSVAIKEYLARWGTQCGVRTEFFEEGTTGALGEAREQALFRIVQEALSNTARHSGARSVNISLCVERDALTLSIADDGRGFEPGAAREGVGLHSMSERMDMLGGSLAVESGPGGTRVTARLALAEGKGAG